MLPIFTNIDIKSKCVYYAKPVIAELLENIRFTF